MQPTAVIAQEANKSNGKARKARNQKLKIGRSTSGTVLGIALIKTDGDTRCITIPCKELVTNVIRCLPDVVKLVRPQGQDSHSLPPPPLLLIIGRNF
jgi:hypothetical protein